MRRPRSAPQILSRAADLLASILYHARRRDFQTPPCRLMAHRRCGRWLSDDNGSQFDRRSRYIAAASGSPRSSAPQDRAVAAGAASPPGVSGVPVGSFRRAAWASRSVIAFLHGRFESIRQHQVGKARGLQNVIGQNVFAAEHTIGLGLLDRDPALEGVVEGCRGRPPWPSVGLLETLDLQDDPFRQATVIDDPGYVLRRLLPHQAGGDRFR